jgi:WD40 repeat protein
MALNVDPLQRPTAAQLQHQLELLSMPTSVRPIQAPDGSDLADIGALVAWCEQHWRTGAAWLYDQLPAQIELWWGQTKLAHDLHAIVTRYSRDTSAGLDAMLALLDPSGFGAQPPQITTDQPRLDFGTLIPRAQPDHTMTLSNPGRRYVHANIKLPSWVVAPHTTIRLPPGEQLAMQLTLYQPRASKLGKLSEDILLQDGKRTLLRVEAHATVAHWNRAWQRLILLAAALVIGLTLLWASYPWILAHQLMSMGAAFPDPNTLETRDAAHYQAAVASMNSNDWDRAIGEFEQLSGTYNDHAILLQQSYYNGARVALQRSDWSTARAYLKRILDYSDARKLLQDSYIKEAQQIGALLILDAKARGATFGPDSRLLIAREAGNVFEIRHVSDGRLLATFKGLPESQVLDGAWSPDGQMLAFSHADGLIQLMRAEDGTVLRIIKGRAGNVRALQWSHDGRMLASYGSELIELWRADGTLLQTLPVNQRGMGVVSVVFSPDDRLLASGSNDGAIKLWRTSDGTLLKEIKQETNALQHMIFRDQGRVLVTVDRNVNDPAQLSFWGVSDGLLLNTTFLPGGPAEVSAFSHDGEMIATVIERDQQVPQLMVWRVADGQILKRFDWLRSTAMSISFSADSKQLASVDADGMLTVNRVTSDE